MVGQTRNKTPKRLEIGCEQIDEASLRRHLLSEAGSSDARIVLVTGELGAGKSLLLEELIVEWARSGPPCHLGARVPILVQCQNLAPDDLGPCNPDTLADRLWERKTPSSSGALATARAFQERSTWRVWEPLWLIDGLDELPRGMLDNTLFRRLAALPGRVCANCCTAVAQAHAFSGVVQPQWHLELLALDPAEQRAFLATCFGGDQPRAASLHNRVLEDAQLRELAGSPLMLDLIARFGERRPPEDCADAVNDMWAQLTNADRTRLMLHKIALLNAVTHSMRIESAVAPVEVLGRCRATMALNSQDGQAVVTAEQAPEIFRRESEKAAVTFRILQEVFLARLLGKRPFDRVFDRIFDLWFDPLYEETQALWIGQALKSGIAAEADRALLGFLNGYLEHHRRNPEGSRLIGRSPLRLVFHLLHRSGADPESLPGTWARLIGILEASNSKLFRIALAIDRQTPSTLRERLACDKDVRSATARAAATAAALKRMADDQDADVRWAVARNAAMPAALLKCLTGDEVADVRRVRADHAAASPALLNRLAVDARAGIRRWVASNAAAPAVVVLKHLAGDEATGVRRAVASNAAAPANVLERLTGDEDAGVRRAVADNTAAPATALERLAGDEDAGVRRAVADNTAAPATALERLADDEDVDVRGSVAGNTAAPATALERLAGDKDPEVRWKVAGNMGAPATALQRLAGDKDAGVRLAAAENPQILLEDCLYWRGRRPFRGGLE